jgi:hypothetical protein
MEGWTGAAGTAGTGEAAAAVLKNEAADEETAGAEDVVEVGPLWRSTAEFAEDGLVRTTPEASFLSSVSSLPAVGLLCTGFLPVSAPSNSIGTGTDMLNCMHVSLQWSKRRAANSNGKLLSDYKCRFAQFHR